MESMEEFVLQLKEKIIRRIERANHITEKKAIVETYCFSFPFLSPDDFKDYIGKEKKNLDFKDELREILKTPEQVEIEANLRSIETGKNIATEHFEYVKKEIRSHAEQGLYKCAGDKKIIEYEIEIPSYKSLIRLPMAGYRDVGGVKFESGIKCEVDDMVLYNSYKQTISSLASEIGATIDIICCFEENGKRTYIDIPGTNISLNERNYVHLQRRTAVYLRGKIEI